MSTQTEERTEEKTSTVGVDIFIAGLGILVVMGFIAMLSSGVIAVGP